MANAFAFHSVCHSLAAYLQTSYPTHEAGVAMPPCTFEVLSSAQMASGPPEQGNRIGLYLYRVAVDTRQRVPAMSGEDTVYRDSPLPLDLHILVSAWGSRAQDEHTTLAWTIRQLNVHPMFGADAMTADAGWRADEVVHLAPAELSLEDSHRIWSALQAPQRLSMAYTARRVMLRMPKTDNNHPVAEIAVVGVRSMPSPQP